MKKMFFPFVILALLSLVISCSEISDSGKTEKNGKARVSFSVQGAGRTLMPTNLTEKDVVKVELSAEILSDEGKYADYSFTDSTGEKTTLSWTGSTALAEFKSSTVELDFGTYNFHLSLYASDEENASPVQTGSIEEIEIDSTTETIAFTNLEYKDNGDVPINVSWKFTDEGRNPIAKVTCSFCTIESKGTEFVLGSDGIYLNNILLSVTEDSENKTASASAYFKSVPNGSYYIKLFLYNTNEGDDVPMNTITEIIKVKGYKTSWNIDFVDLSELNVLYYVCYHQTGDTVGTWGTDWNVDSEGLVTVTRNAYTSVVLPTSEDFIPPEGMNTLTWYTDSACTEIYEGTTIKAKTAENDTAHDYDLYAKWTYVAEASGNISTDNRALLISIDNTELYQNSTVNFSVTDADGNELSSDETVAYTAKILYKGTDINEYAESSDFYTVSGAKLTLKGATNSIPARTYQLYVTATRSGTPEVTSSQTFEITIGDSFATPETQVALYSTSSYPYTHSYYLANSVETANFETADYTASVNSQTVNSIAFDVAGNFYSINDKKVVSTNSKANGISLSSQLSSYTSNNGVLVDLATNIAYSYGISNTQLALFKYPSLISSGSIDDVISYTTISDVPNYTYYPDKVALYDNKLYVSFNLSNDSDAPYLKVYDISSETSLDEYANFDIKEYATTESDMGLSSVAVNDIFAMEGSVYLLVRESFNGTEENKNIYRRGSVIEYIPGTGPTRFLELNATPTIENTDISNMSLYYSGTNYNEDSPLYAEEGSGSPSSGATAVTVANLGAEFPNIYGVAESEKFLSSPAKVIGIKPKKLVIADDGCAFYSDLECLKYKNMNRVATIDLEKFVVDSVETTTAEFTSNISSYLRSGIAISTLNSVTPSQETGYYFESSGSSWVSATVSEKTSALYLSVKPGE